MKKFWLDFKDFAMKGNVVDMAVGVVVGSAFGKIVSSLVADIITPLISLILGKVSLADLKLVMQPAVLDDAGKVFAKRGCAYIRQFYTVGYRLPNHRFFSIFVVMRALMNLKKTNSRKLRKRKQSRLKRRRRSLQKELETLCEIRDLLKRKKAKQINKK